MYAKLVVLSTPRKDGVNGEIESVTIGFFDETGVLQLEVPRVSGKLFPKDIVKGREIAFFSPTSISQITNKK